MSLSNIGEFQDAGAGKVKFVKDNATDYDGVRFDKVADFINGCGSANTSNVFKIIGFSGAAIKGNPAMSGCQGGFFGKDKALSAVQNLKGLQEYNKKNIENTDFNPSMQNTTYQDGLECAKAVVTDDIQQSPGEAKNANYMVFFVTDGKSSDNCRADSVAGRFRDKDGTCCPGGAIMASGGCCAPGVTATQKIMFSEYCCQVAERRNEQNRCEKDPTYTPITNNIYNPSYESIIRDMMLVGRQKAGSIRLQPIYYGPTTEALEASKMLDQFATWGDGTSTIMLNDVHQADFCKYANSPVKTEYQTAEFNVVNLTAIMKDGILRADSDMDGVPDKFDPDPVNARSNAAGILDGICQSSSGDFSCRQPNNCNKDRVTPFHLSECDLAALSMADGDGVDYDKDRIPDFIEILRGTLPTVNDAFNNLDGDGLTNLQEIHVGRQVDSPDDSVGPELLLDWSISRLKDTDQCPANQQSWKISLNRIPTVPVKAYKDPLDKNFPNSKFRLSHDENENVIFIYYISEPLNSQNAPAEIFGTTIKVPYGVQDLSKIKINPESFQKLGSLTGKAQW
jgi:hypothetical protein